MTLNTTPAYLHATWVAMYLALLFSPLMRSKSNVAELLLKERLLRRWTIQLTVVQIHPQLTEFRLKRMQIINLFNMLIFPIPQILALD